MKPFFTFFCFLFLLLAIYLLFFSCKPVKQVAYPSSADTPDSLFTRVASTDTIYNARTYLTPLPDNLQASMFYYRWRKLYNRVIAY